MEERKKQLFTFFGKISPKKLKKDQLLILVLAGILLLVIAIPTEKKGDGKGKTETGLSLSEGKTETNQNEYLYNLERRLESALSQMSGAGDVTVMITLKSSAANEAVSESDSQGGKRTTQNAEHGETTVYSDGGQTGEPYVSKELSPQIEGVVVIAEGGADSVVKQNITEAVQALFGIDTHKIRIMKKSSK